MSDTKTSETGSGALVFGFFAGTTALYFYGLYLAYLKSLIWFVVALVVPVLPPVLGLFKFIENIFS